MNKKGLQKSYIMFLLPKFLNYSNPYDDFTNIHVSPEQICCLYHYFGKTDRAFHTRCKEHMRDVNSKKFSMIRK